MTAKHFTYKVILNMLRLMPNRFKGLLSEDITSTVTTPHRVKLYVQGRMMVNWMNYLWKKEPETIRWIDEMPTGSSFWDIGANIGYYSIYACNKGQHVTAFEPGSANYALLCKNIKLNRSILDTYCLAISDGKRFDTLYMASGDTGRAHNSYGEAIDPLGDTLDYKWHEDSIGYSIDELSSRLRFPNYIKIDVDGIEGKILEGSSETLKDKRLKGLMVELYPERPDYNNIVRGMRINGFVCSNVRENHFFSRVQ